VKIGPPKMTEFPKTNSNLHKKTIQQNTNQTNNDDSKSSITDILKSIESGQDHRIRKLKTQKDAPISSQPVTKDCFKSTPLAMKESKIEDSDRILPFEN
jgi:hypothetical protein